MEITLESLHVAGWCYTRSKTGIDTNPYLSVSEYEHDDTGDCIDIMSITEDTFKVVKVNGKDLTEPITTMIGLSKYLDELDTQPSDIQLIEADGWEKINGSNIYTKQGMYLQFVGTSLQLLIGNSAPMFYSYSELKAFVKKQLDNKYRWLK